MFTEKFILPKITTERLILRRFNEGDTELVYSAFSVSSFTEPMLIDRQPDRIFAATYIDELISAYDEGRGYTWAVTLRENEACVGAVSLDIKDNNALYAEVGYWVADSYKSNGFATEAVLAIKKYAFEYMHTHKLYARCSINNSASIRVLKKCGFTIEGISRDAVKRHGEYISLAWFAAINDEQ